MAGITTLVERMVRVVSARAERPPRLDPREIMPHALISPPAPPQPPKGWVARALERLRDSWQR